MQGKLNREWHKAHPMPKNPMMDQRVQWHLEHARHCQCRTTLPAPIREEFKKRKIRSDR